MEPSFPYHLITQVSIRIVFQVGDVKTGSAVQEALSCIAETCTLEYVSHEVIAAAFEQKNPKNQSEALNWLAQAIKEFGFKYVPFITILAELVLSRGDGHRAAFY